MRSGALFDSTMDQCAEFYVFFGFLSYFPNGWMFYIVVRALMGSLIVIENLGLLCHAPVVFRWTPL